MFILGCSVDSGCSSAVSLPANLRIRTGPEWLILGAAGALAFTEAAEFARTIELRAPEADADDEEMYAEPTAKASAVKKEEGRPGAST